MRSRALVLLVSLALLTALLPISARAAITVPASGTGFTGTLTLQEFEGGQSLVAVSTLSGTLTVGTGTVNVVQSVNLFVDLNSATATCEALHLEIGPMDLNLLGVAIHADKIVLNIAANEGSVRRGLLCAIANSLNNPPVLARHLNQLLTLL